MKFELEGLHPDTATFSAITDKLGHLELRMDRAVWDRCNRPTTLEILLPAIKEAR